MNISRYLIFLLLAGTINLSSCKSQNKFKATALDSLATTKLGTSRLKEFNSSNTYVLYKESEDTISYQHPVKYVVFRVNDNHIELEGRFSRGYIKWLDNRKIEIKSVPEKAIGNPDQSPYVRQVFID